jgi:hypothetical protein
MLLTAYRQVPSVYRLRAGTATDSYGDPIESWTTPERVLLKGATVQDEKSEEEGRVIRGEKVLFVPGEVDLTEGDRIEFRGEQWRVNGDPTVKAGLASRSFTTATLTRSEAT